MVVQAVPPYGPTIVFVGFGVLGYLVCTLITAPAPTWQFPNQSRGGVTVGADAPKNGPGFNGGGGGDGGGRADGIGGAAPGGGVASPATLDVQLDPRWHHDGSRSWTPDGGGGGGAIGSETNLLGFGSLGTGVRGGVDTVEPGSFQIPQVAFPHEGTGDGISEFKARLRDNPPAKYLSHLWGPKVLPQTGFGRDGAPMVDIVSLTLEEDFLQVLHNKGLESWLRHMHNIRSITFISRPQDLEPMKRHLRSSGLPAKLPIRFFDETYFHVNYNKPFGVPYGKVFQQMIKLHAFDIPGLLPNIVIVDSDTIWAQDYIFVYKNGSGSYFNKHYYTPEEIPWQCTGMDPVMYVNLMLNGAGWTNLTESRQEGGLLLAAPAITDRTKHPEVCDFSPYCGSPDATGDRHIAHHMLFQRDVMVALHTKAIEHFGGSSLWEATMKCWRHPSGKCRSRIAEYELYYTFAACHYGPRVIDTWPIYIGSGNNCSVTEMELCADRGVLLKMCNDGADKHPWTRGECADVPTDGVDPSKKWKHPRDRQHTKHW